MAKPPTRHRRRQKAGLHLGPFTAHDVQCEPLTDAEVAALAGTYGMTKKQFEALPAPEPFASVRPAMDFALQWYVAELTKQHSLPTERELARKEVGAVRDSIAAAEEV